MAIEVGDDPSSPEWSYHLEFNQNKNRTPIVKREIVKKKNVVLLNRPLKSEENDPELQTQTDLEQVRANKQFRAISEYFKSIHYLHIVPQLMREPERSVGKTNDPYGGDFLEELAKFKNEHESNFDKRLEKINDALNVAVPQLKKLKLEKDFKGTPHLSGLFEHWRPDAGWQKENDFSDGTLRLLGLLWATLDTQGPLLLEEPELSLHPGVVRYIPQMFARVISKKKQSMQIIVSTHSEEIISDSGIDPREILMVRPSKEGSIVEPVSDTDEIKTILDSGLSVSDFITSKMSPVHASRLTDFG